MADKGFDGDRVPTSGDLEPPVPDAGLARRQGERGEAAPGGFAGVADDQEVVVVGDQLGADQGGRKVAAAGKAVGKGGEPIPPRRAVAAAGAGERRAEDALAGFRCCGSKGGTVEDQGAGGAITGGLRPLGEKVARRAG